MSKITNDGRLNPVYPRMLYSCIHMATVGVKGLIIEHCRRWVSDKRANKQSIMHCEWVVSKWC